MFTPRGFLNMALRHARTTRRLASSKLTRSFIGCGFAAIIACAAASAARAQDDPPAAEEEKPREVDARLKTIGALGASHIYTSFGYIGTVADAVAKDVYPPERAEDLMREMIGMIDVNVANLRDVRKTGLTESDIAAVDAMIDIYGSLKIEAQALTRFANSRSNEDAEAFEKARLAAWPKIARLLGLKANDAQPDGASQDEKPDDQGPVGAKPDDEKADKEAPDEPKGDGQ